jgi:hypothetical protein
MIGAHKWEGYQHGFRAQWLKKYVWIKYLAIPKTGKLFVVSLVIDSLPFTDGWLAFRR